MIFLTALSLIFLPSTFAATTVSGISAGAFMATQLQIAYSDQIKGMGSIAGGPYWCAQGGGSLYGCLLSPEQIDLQVLWNRVSEEEQQGKVAATSNLRNARVYIFQSKADAVVKPASSQKLQGFLTRYISPSNLKTEWMEKAAHAFPTFNFGKSCDTTGIPYVVNCKKDIAGEMLQHLLGNLKAPVAPIGDNLKHFSQREFADAGLHEDAWAYVPAACARENHGCSVHLALHGCQMGPDFIGDEFRAHAGYNGWAESNNLIVVYPSVNSGFGNPNGCWDWFGYTNENYANRTGPQMEALMKIAARFTKNGKLSTPRK